MQRVLDRIREEGRDAALTDAELALLRRAPRQSLSDIDPILDVLCAGGGTGALTEGERRLLELPENRARISERLRDIIDEDDDLPDTLLNFFSDSTRAGLLLPLFNFVLLRKHIVGLLASNDAQFGRFRAVAALSAVIADARLPSRAPENRTRQDLQPLIRTQSAAIAAASRSLIASCTGYTTSMQRLVHTYAIDPYLTCRVEWLRKLVEATAAERPPTPDERASYHDWVVSRDASRGIESEILPRLQATLSRLEEQRPRSPADIQAARTAIRQKTREKNQLGRKMRQIERRFGARFAMVAEFLAREQRGQNTRDPRVLNERDIELRDLDALLDADSPKLFRDGDAQGNWRRYRLVLERLTKGEGNASLEFLIKPFLEVYGKVNRNRDIGLHEEYTGGTYTGHGENAIDINTRAGADLFVAVPREFRPPARLFPVADALLATPRRVRSWERFRYERSFVRAGTVRVSTDLQDIFGKLTYLLPPRSPIARRMLEADLGRPLQAKFSEDDLGRVMQRYGADDLAPAYLSQNRDFDIWRILAGLAFERLTDTPDAEHFDELRREILFDWEALAAEKLHIPGAVLFERAFLFGADIGVPRLITLAIRAGRHSKTLTEVQRALLDVLLAPAQRTHDYEHVDGLLHQIWRLFIQLHSTGNVELHHRGQSVTVTHLFKSELGPPNPDLAVDVFHTHLSWVDPRLAQGPQQLFPAEHFANVGQTGNAFTPHLHLEIKLSYGDRPIGTVLPHEFYETAG